jgi:hypothetical protein
VRAKTYHSTFFGRVSGRGQRRRISVSLDFSPHVHVGHSCPLRCSALCAHLKGQTSAGLCAQDHTARRGCYRRNSPPGRGKRLCRYAGKWPGPAQRGHHNVSLNSQPAYRRRSRTWIVTVPAWPRFRIALEYRTASPARGCGSGSTSARSAIRARSAIGGAGCPSGPATAHGRQTAGHASGHGETPGRGIAQGRQARLRWRCHHRGVSRTPALIAGGRACFSAGVVAAVPATAPARLAA